MIAPRAGSNDVPIVAPIAKTQNAKALATANEASSGTMRLPSAERRTGWAANRNQYAPPYTSAAPGPAASIETAAKIQVPRNATRPTKRHGRRVTVTSSAASTSAT